MKIKELQKTVNIAWSPLPQNPIYLAAGTAAQQFDSSAASSTLEIYSTNFADPSYDLKLTASLPSQYRFQKLIWSPTGCDGAHTNGLIVGGCEGGHVMIYSAAKMLANEEGIIARQDKHTGPVSGLDVNPFQKNLLASCASESEIFIWDLNNTTTHMNPGTKTQPLEDVQNVAWNRQVQHILASVFSSRCVIWDLRKSEQIIKLSDTQSRVRWHAIQWHPDVATQVWLASEDDQAPVVQLWDLRYATAPAKTMQIHQRGVLGMSWCPRDTDLMVSCGKDNRIYCWNPNTEASEGEILSEVATTATWYSDVQWCPRNPALIASSSLDGNVSIYSLFGGTQQQVQTANKIADSFPGMDRFAQAPQAQQATQIVYHDLKFAPKWIRRPCGVSFGFGGKLIDFNANAKSVNISQVITEPALVERAEALQSSLNDANYIDYCRQRADEMPDQDGRYLWYFIKANFELSPKEELLNLLGYNREDIEVKFAKFIKKGETTTNDANDVDQLTQRISHLAHSDSSELECDQSSDGSTDTQAVDNDAVFDDIATAQREAESAAEQPPHTHSDLSNLIRTPFKIPSGEHPDSVIAEALLTGNVEAAVEMCMERKRTTEALMIASTGGLELLNETQNRILRAQQSHSDLANLILALVTHDWSDFVGRCGLDSWREALVAALKHSERKLVDICEQLGDRLLAAAEGTASVEQTRHAMLCYVCAGSIDKLVSAWYQAKRLEQHNASYTLTMVELQELAEVVMLVSKSLEQQGIAIDVDGRFAEFITEYGGLLASQGALNAALTYIFALGSTSKHGELRTLRERIYNTVNYKKVVAAPSVGAATQQAMYGRGQQQRGSFSQPSAFGGSGGYTAQPAQPAIAPLNPWNTAPVAPVAPAIFNPQVQAQAVKPPPPPPLINDTLTQQPARPLSNSSSQSTATSGAASGGGLLSRSKYVLDPSVAPAGPGYGAAYNPAPAATGFNTTPFMHAQQPMQPNAAVYGGGGGGGNYWPGQAPMDASSQQTMAPPPPGAQNTPRNPTPPPGWNDPPALKSTRASLCAPNSFNNYNNSNSSKLTEMSARHAGTRRWAKIIATTTAAAPTTSASCDALLAGKSGGGGEPFEQQQYYNNAFSPSYSSPLFAETFLYRQSKKSELSAVAPAAPITQPLYGVDPNQNQNGYIDPNAHYQTHAMGMPPPPTSNNGMGNYLQSGAAPLPTQSNNNPAAPPQFPQQMNFQNPAIVAQQQQQQQQQPQQQPWNMPAAANMGYTEQPAPVLRQSEPPKEKPPLQEEYIYLQTVLEELKNQCLSAASDPRTKRKFVDVAKRLENLYDCLRDERLTSATISALNQIVQAIQIGDYSSALQTQTQIAFGSQFSQCAGFMPGLKVLVQSANDLHVYLR